MNAFVLVDNVPDFDFHYRNLSRSIAHLFSLPIKFLSKLHRPDDPNDILLKHAYEHTAAQSLSQQSHAVERSFVRQFEADSRSLVGLPGPFAFIMSGYALGLIVVALLLNRIQNLVVPTRHALAVHLNRTHLLPNLPLAALFPINLNSTKTRFLLRFPSIYLLCRSLLILSIAILHASNSFPSWNIEWVQKLGYWEAEMQMSDICWDLYRTACVTMVMSQLCAGLEGLSASPVASFNLFGFAFLLHMYASPVTHAKGPSAPNPSRPDMHVLATILFPLLQLAGVHFLNVIKTWSKNRLIPTSIVGILQLCHFHYVVFSAPAHYPLLNYLPSVVDTWLLLVTTMTVTLNALTQLLLDGKISSPLFRHTSPTSQEPNLFGVHPAAMPGLEEEFSVALCRLGTAAFEATGVAGLGNEMTVVPRPTVSLDRSGVRSLSSLKNNGIAGFDNEITNVDVKIRSSHLPTSVPLVETPWTLEARRYLVCVAKVLRHLWLQSKRKLRLKAAPNVPTLVNEGEENQPQLQRTSASGLITPPRERSTESRSEVEYQKFIRGQTVSDDEDDEYEPPSSTPSEDEDDNELNEVTSPESGGDSAEMVDLYSDLTTTTVPSRPPTPVLVAHLASSTSTPITRRRYDQIVNPRGSPGLSTDQWSNFLVERRQSASMVNRTEDTSGMDDEIKRNCVICTAEPRDVICWPCRCLALCDGCRANLASRSAAHRHSCPCCRTVVHGYSRIYIP